MSAGDINVLNVKVLEFENSEKKGKILDVSSPLEVLGMRMNLQGTQGPHSPIQSLSPQTVTGPGLCPCQPFGFTAHRLVLLGKSTSETGEPRLPVGLFIRSRADF